MKVLGYILLFYIGFYFYRLAENHNKSKWLFGIVGISTYLTALSIYPLYLRFFELDYIDELDLAKITWKSFLIGLVSVFILFQVLSLLWSRKKKVNKKEIDKIGK